MRELSVLALFVEKREMYDKYAAHMRSIENLDRGISLLLRCIQEYYTRYPEHNYIGEEEFVTFYRLLYPENHEQQIHLELIARIYKAEVSTDVVTDLIEQIIERHVATAILGKLVPVIDGHQFGVVPSLQYDVENFLSVMKNPPKESNDLEPVSMSPYDLIKGRSELVGAPWHMEPLNTYLGPLALGTLGAIFAYVDTGKTSFGLSACASFAKYYKDSKESILYTGNEESGQRLSERLVTAFMGKSDHELLAGMSKEELDSELAGRGWHRIKIIDGVSHVRHVKKLIEEWRPVCMFIDQGTKVSSGAKVKDVQEIRLLYNLYRDLAREYNCAIICMEQGASDSEGKKYLNLSHIYGSKVAIQGELDYAIGIGKVLNDQTKEFIRYINIPKNKLKEGRKASFPSTFEAERCLWKTR